MIICQQLWCPLTNDQYFLLQTYYANKILLKKYKCEKYAHKIADRLSTKTDHLSTAEKFSKWEHFFEKKLCSQVVFTIQHLLPLCSQLNFSLFLLFFFKSIFRFSFLDIFKNVHFCDFLKTL